MPLSSLMRYQLIATCVDTDTGEQLGPAVTIGEFTTADEMKRVTRQLVKVLASLKPRAIGA